MAGGNTYGASVRERTPRADGYRHIDTTLLISRLKAMHANTYTYGVWESPTDWDDLRLEFAPAAQRAGIDVMVYLVPPSECVVDDSNPLLDGRCSRPFRNDFKAWATNIAQLAAQYPNVKSWSIDDFVVSEDSAGMFTREYLADIKAITESISPELKFYVTLYGHQITDKTLDLLDESLDGILYPYLGSSVSTIDDTSVTTRLDAYGPILEAHGMELLLLVYGGRYLMSNVPPDAQYVAGGLEKAQPYVADGRIAGIVAYGAPLDIDLPRPSNEYRAHSGSGSLSFSIPNFQPTSAGMSAQASESIEVTPGTGAKTLSFWHFDQNRPGDLGGYHFKQILIDDAIVWQTDVSADAGDSWIKTTVDLTDALADKSAATLTVRLYEQLGVSWWPIDVRFDDLEASGFTITDPGFEHPGSWSTAQTDPALWAYHDVYHVDEPIRIVNAFGDVFAQLQDQGFRPLPGKSFAPLRPGPENRAMYGNGWLEFSTTGDPIAAGSCATATQTVKVDHRLPRQELSWWHTDRIQVAPAGVLEKRILIDGNLIWPHDVSDEWPWDYIQGSILQGPIDVTHLVAGKDTVTVTLALCALSTGTIPDIHASFDRIESVGLDIRNAGFEFPCSKGCAGRWRLTAPAGYTADIKSAGPPVRIP